MPVFLISYTCIHKHTGPIGSRKAMGATGAWEISDRRPKVCKGTRQMLHNLGPHQTMHPRNSRKPGLCMCRPHKITI